MADVDKWVYSAIIKDHFMKPRGFLLGEPKEGEFDSYGEVGSLACGDIIKVWIKVDEKTEKIKDFKWQTWGCATAIASASAFAEMIMEKCSTAGWDSSTKAPTGCTYVKWLKPGEVPTSNAGEEFLPPEPKEG